MAVALALGALAFDSDSARQEAEERARQEMQEEVLQRRLAASPLPEGIHALEPPPVATPLYAVLDAGLSKDMSDQREQCGRPCPEYKSLEEYGIQLEQLRPLFRKAVRGTFQPIRSYRDKVASHQAYVWLIDLGCTVLNSDQRVQREFASLLSDREPLDVRLAAAARMLYIDPDIALPVLRRIARSNARELAIKARILLQDWQNGMCDIGL